MSLTLFTHNFGQMLLRLKLANKKEFIPNQKGVPIKRPTLKWIYRLFSNITELTLIHKSYVTERLCNLTELHQKIVMLFGKSACEVYGFR